MWYSKTVLAAPTNHQNMLICLPDAGPISSIELLVPFAGKLYDIHGYIDIFSIVILLDVLSSVKMPCLCFVCVYVYLAAINTLKLN